MNTKEKILCESLRLFAQKGYDAVGVVQIAEAVGIKAPSLYKHYKNKRAIFNSIIERVNEMDAAFAARYQMPADEMEKSYHNLSAEHITSYTKAMFLHWTEETFSCNFRRLLTLEQYKSAEMGSLYQQYIAGGPVKYMTDIFMEFSDSNMKAHELALEFYGPMHLMYSLYDGGVNKDCLLSLLQNHIHNFWGRLRR